MEAYTRMYLHTLAKNTAEDYCYCPDGVVARFIENKLMGNNLTRKLNLKHLSETDQYNLHGALTALALDIVYSKQDQHMQEGEKWALHIPKARDALRDVLDDIASRYGYKHLHMYAIRHIIREAEQFFRRELKAPVARFNKHGAPGSFMVSF